MKAYPLFAALVNALFPGAGYLMIRERVVFGVFMLIGSLLFAAVMFTDPSPSFDSFLLAVTSMGRTLEFLSYFMIALAFGYDAYTLARKKVVVVAPQPAAFL